MCGIIGYVGKSNAVPYLIKGLSELEYRGYDSAGIAVFESDGITSVKSAGRLGNLKERLEDCRAEGCCGIGHTRWATHGEPTDINAHPHMSSGGVFSVVHNGIIENCQTLKRELSEDGFTFSSETDTEVMVNILEKNYEGDVVEAILKSADTLKGSYAAAILCRDFPDRIYAVRKGSPLICAESKEGCFLASDITPLLTYTNEVCILGEGEIAVMNKDGIEIYGSDGEKAEKKPSRISWRKSDAEKGGFEHFMLKEIFEQPQMLRQTFCSFTENGELFPKLAKLRKSFLTLDKIYFIGCGSAYHVGVSGKILTEKLCNITCIAERASEFRYADIPVDEKTLCIFISQSGETADTLAALKKAKEKKAKVLSVINAVGSSMARESDNVLYTLAGPEIAVATTKAYSAQLMTVYLFSLCLAHERWQMKRARRDALIRELLQLGDKVEEVISAAERLKALSKVFEGYNDGYFIGRGSDYAAALEGSLKMKEISYIHTEAYPAGELKHGTISLIEKGTPVIALCSQEDVFEKMLSNIKEVKARGANVIVFTKKKYLSEFKNQENVFVIPDTDDNFSGITLAVALQLISYYTALSRGCDIDKPRNLAKSVTVE